ncbi:MAG: sodium:solute symporter family protein, partial [Saprospiraceae bacterium]|nr:sodium:solute symporter family protein [Saprospiraceae bacterium]
FGIVTFMANAELGYKYGFAGITPGIALMLAMFVIGWSGFCIKPLRDERVITLPEFFDKKFGKKVRWACGVVIVLGGLLNMGVFLRMGGDFLTVVLGVDPGYLEVMMTVLLLIVAAYTILGGMLSVLVTDYLQFVVMSLGLIVVSALFLSNYGWTNLTDVLMAEYGERAFNPFIGGQYGWDRVCLDVFLAFASVLTWQTMITRILAARDTKTGQGIYRGTAPFFLVRFTIPALFGIIAFYYFTREGLEPGQDILAMPQLIAAVVPVGLLGLVVAAMLAADMSTNSSYLLAWSSVIYNDILEPFHKNKWSQKKGLRTNRILVTCIGIFLLVYGLWFPLKGDLWVYLQITGTIYLASMSVILIAGCYWKAANDWGAIASIITGGMIPITFLVMQQMDRTQELATAIGPYKSGIAAYVLTGVAMVVGSRLKDVIVRE